MVLSVGIEEPTDHALVLRAMLFGFAFEELDATLGQGERDLYALFVQNQFLWFGQKVRNDFQSSQRLVRVFDFRAHKFSFLCAKIQRQ